MGLMKVVLVGAWTAIHRGGSNAQLMFWLRLVKIGMNTSPRLVGRASDELYETFKKLGVRP